VVLSAGTNLTDSYSYDAFGNVRTRKGTSTQPFQYLGNSFDSTTKLYDFHARMYDPSVGRFTSKDPVRGYVELPQTLNPYVYGRDNPLVYTDPYGQDTVGVCSSASGEAGNFGISGQKCWVTDFHSIKITDSLSGAGRVGTKERVPIKNRPPRTKKVLKPSASLLAHFQYTTAESVDQLAGRSMCDSVDAKLGAGLKYTLCGGDHYSGDFGAGLTPGPPGIEAQPSASFTVVRNPNVWDLVLPFGPAGEYHWHEDIGDFWQQLNETREYYLNRKVE